MQIDSELLIQLGAIEVKAKRNEPIFHEGDQPRHYYQIISGKVKMISTTSEGKEYIQGIFIDGESFGEPLLFIPELYPASAIASSYVSYYRLPISMFLYLVETNHQILMNFTRMFARRIFSKAQSARDLITNTPEFRILGMIQNYKRKHTNLNQEILIPFTRQEIAHFTGLRVETVIRTLKQMQKESKVRIKDRKLYF